MDVLQVRRGYKTELDPNLAQCALLRKHAGAARWAYNWGLSTSLDAIRAGRRPPSAMALHRELNARKRLDLAWLYEVSKCAPQEALRNLQRAFRSSQPRRRGGAQRAPRFKKRRVGCGSFRLTGTIRVSDRSIVLPRLGDLRLKETGYLPTEAHVLSATVSERGGRWYVSVQVVESRTVVTNRGPAVGVDLGITHLVAVSDGRLVRSAGTPERERRRLRTLQRDLSRKLRGSRNRMKAAAYLARVSRRITNRRVDVLHKITTELTKTKSLIVIEDLNVTGMMRNHCIARALGEAAFFEFRRQLQYKAKWYGSEVALAPRFFASSRICSGCGAQKSEISLRVRVFECVVCGTTADRDVNAARNLLDVVLSSRNTKNAGGGALGRGPGSAHEAGTGSDCGAVVAGERSRHRETIAGGGALVLFSDQLNSGSGDPIRKVGPNGGSRSKSGAVPQL